MIDQYNISLGYQLKQIKLFKRNSFTTIFTIIIKNYSIYFNSFKSISMINCSQL